MKPLATGDVSFSLSFKHLEVSQSDFSGIQQSVKSTGKLFLKGILWLKIMRVRVSKWT